jgi:hypothetical protein
MENILSLADHFKAVIDFNRTKVYSSAITYCLDGKTVHTKYDDGCCHKTRIKGSPCPLGWICPYDRKVDLLI